MKRSSNTQPTKARKTTAKKDTPSVPKSKGAKPRAGRFAVPSAGDTEDLKNRLREAEETLDAIRSGAVDALVVSAPGGAQVYTLKGAEYPYRVFFETMNEGAAVISREGIILACNRSFENMLGVDPARLIGSSFYDYIPIGERAKISSFIKGICNAKTVECRQDLRGETVLLASGGKSVPVQLALSATHEIEKAHVCAVITDLTDRKRVEEVLQRSRDELELRVRERTEELQASRVDLESRNKELLFVQGQLENNAAELETSNAELEAQNRELQRAADDLAASEEKYRSIFEGANDGIIACDLITGKFLFANNKMASLLGYSVEEITGLAMKDIHPPKDLPYVLEEFNKMAAGKITETRAIPVLRKGGDIVYCDIGSSLLDKTKLIGFFRDITARRQAEEQVMLLNQQLKRQIAELDAANKELDSFAYSVSHDLRAPLRSISGFIKILSQDYSKQLDDQGRDYMTRVYSGAEKMNKLIEELLYLSHISRQDLDRLEYNISNKAASIVENMRAADPGRNVDVNIQQGVVVSADPGLTDVILSNLFGNAWKFTLKTGKARIEFGALLRDAKTVLYIKDNGAGFHPEHKDDLFLPFRRLHADKEFEGTGIGLSIVERIVRRHGGRIWAEGEPGKGATFYFTLS